MSRRYVRRTLPVEPLRRAFENSGLTYSEVCYQLGWTKRMRGRNGKSHIAADTTRLRRALGTAPESSGRRILRRTIGYDHAQRIARAMDLDPSVVDSWLPEPQPEKPAPATDGRCPECGTTGTWTDSWDQERCDQCWAIVATAEAA